MATTPARPSETTEEPSRPGRDDTSIPTLASELVSLVVGYAKQETIDPLKSLARFVAFGVAGALLLAIGGGLAALAAVRVVQTETAPHLSGDWSWAPYGAGILLVAAGAGLALTRIGKRRR
ncbi:MAG TPA: hypothetical protein VMW49_06080 [Candidatus Dormibacteraeota bacterium]|nr:hypothetical protein [Candidatus Dormibacteraeota bacterium]